MNSVLVDTCCHEERMGMVAEYLRKAMPGVYILQVKIGETQFDDFLNSIRLHPDRQIEIVCKMISEDPLLADGYNAIGWSQGSQLL